ncbi:MAG: response regulator [Marinibacterium sp.]|nr:response regulator [Marinibacterium sp.]
MSLANKLAEERRARLAAERLLELKQAELSAANRKLGRHALALTKQIGATQAEVETVRDENERVKSDLTEANHKVQQAEKRLWLSIQSIQDGFAFFDPDGYMIGANTAYLSIFDDLEEVGPGVSYMRILQLLTDEGIVNTGDLDPKTWRDEMARRWQAPTPSQKVIQLWNERFIRLIDQRGHDGDIVSLALDITPTVRYEAQLRAERERAEAANRAKSAFLANMSHEIRTPMNGVVGMAELLGDTGLNDEQQLYVNTIKNSGEALLVIINDVLDYSKIEADKLKLNPEPFDLERCIHEVVMLLQPIARDKGIAMAVDYDLFLHTNFVGDPGRVRQVLTNLAGNAVKFTLEGHVLIRVTGVPGPDGHSSVHISIEDTGIGIPEDKVQHIFGEFNQVEDDRNRNFEGTGLGLAISQRLIKMMGGELWVESEEGVGSCFGFKMDMPHADAGAPPKVPQMPAEIRKVLIVDDLEVNRIILDRQISALGVTPVTCSRAGEALDRMSDDIDLVLTDHVMPDMDGLEFAQALRDRGWQGPVVLLSSNPTVAHNDPGASQLTTILQKPLQRAELFSLLADLEGRSITPDIPRLPDAAPPADEPDARPMRVLVAEDNKTNQLVFRKMVKDLDIDLVFANNGLEALDAYGEALPDLIFMDISMPKMDGKTAAREIRKIEQDTGNHVPIVAVTAHAMSGDADDILAAGIDFYLTKPLRKAALHDRIGEHCPDEARPPLPDDSDAA